MKAPTPSIYLYPYNIKQSIPSPVVIRITYQRERRFYNTQIDMLNEDYLNPKSKLDKNKVDNIHRLLLKAKDVISELGNSFSFDRFERLFLQNTALKDVLSECFRSYIAALSEEQVGTRGNYSDAMMSFVKFDAKARLADISPEWLKRYENWAKKRGNSTSTTGMYCRSLRAIINKEIRLGNMAKDLYPFGRGLFDIPTSRNIKKALNIEDIKSIMDFVPPPDTAFERDRDLWLLIYLCNGINATDICHLKNSHLKGDSIEFERQKTKNTKRDKEPIYISLLPMAIGIIEKHRSANKHPDAFLFPFILEEMNFDQRKEKIKSVCKAINSSMKKIAKAIGIDKEVTTYYARHSFATIMINSGANISMVSKMLGHSSIATTERYFAGFVKEEAKKAVSALMPK